MFICIVIYLLGSNIQPYISLFVIFKVSTVYIDHEYVNQCKVFKQDKETSLLKICQIKVISCDIMLHDWTFNYIKPLSFIKKTKTNVRLRN